VRHSVEGKDGNQRFVHILFKVFQSGRIIFTFLLFYIDESRGDAQQNCFQNGTEEGKENGNKGVKNE